MRRAIWATGVVMAAGGVVALLLLGGEPPPRPDGTDPVPESPTPSGPAPNASTQQPVERPAESGDDLRVELEFEVHATLRATGELPIAVWRQGARAEGVVVRAVAGDTTARGDQPLLVAVEIGKRVWHRLVERRADGAHSVELGFDRELGGRVVDRRGVPVIGARIWCGGDLEEIVATDDDGRFRAMIPSGRGVPVVVQADGLASRARFVDVAADGPTTVDFQLADEVPLEIRATGLARSLREARARIVPVGTETDLLAWPAFAQGLLFDTVLDENGSATVRGLPANATLAVLVHGPAMRCQTSGVATLRRTSSTFDVPIAPHPGCRGRVVDPTGAPIADALVRLSRQDTVPAATGTGNALVPADQPRPGEILGRSDSGGAFELALPSDRREAWQLTARAFGVEVAVAVPTGQVAELRAVVPPPPVLPARLVVPPPVAGVAWTLRCLPDGQEQRIAADASAIVPVASAIADVVVRVVRKGAEPQSQTLSKLVLSGDVTLQR